MYLPQYVTIIFYPIVAQYLTSLLYPIHNVWKTYIIPSLPQDVDSLSVSLSLSLSPLPFCTIFSTHRDKPEIYASLNIYTITISYHISLSVQSIP